MHLQIMIAFSSVLCCCSCSFGKENIIFNGVVKNRANNKLWIQEKLSKNHRKPTNFGIFIKYPYWIYIVSKSKKQHDMEIHHSKIKYSRRIHQSVHNTIFFQSACLIQLLCLVVSANLQQDLHDRKIIKSEVEDTSHNGKQGGRQTETDRNFVQIENETG